MKNKVRKVVVITGASSGIGKALAYGFAEKDIGLVLAARREDQLLSIQYDLLQRGVNCIIVKTDVSIASDCQRLIDKTVEHFGKVDILINNAGISMRALFKDVEISVLERLMAVNFWGSVHCTKAALSFIVRSKGTIVGVSSIAGYVGLPGRTGYSASKFALQGFLESLRNELSGDGVQVLIACPGYTSSEIRRKALMVDGSEQGKTPLKEDKIMSAEEVASAIIEAIEKRKRTLILTREGKMAVWLNKWFPYLLSKMVIRKVKKEGEISRRPR